MCRLGDHLQTDRLDVFLTHAHLDHIAGLTYLINVVPREVLDRTVVHGEATKLAAVREHLFAEPIFPVRPPFQFEAFGDGACDLAGGGRLTHFPLQHPGGSLGFRLDWPGQSIAYITDTTAAEHAEYVSKIRGVDLLLHEAYFASDADNLPVMTGHSSIVTVAKVAAAANVKRLLLVHIDPRCEDDRIYDLGSLGAIYSNVTIGCDGMELEF
jgi:ribonuclease BN (tRNA processing enzyme)